MVLCQTGAAQEPATQPADEAAVEPASDDELSKRLIKRAVTGGPDDVMTQVMDLMAEAGDRLVVQLDPGAETQTVQKRIIDRLDEAIKRAMQQRQKTSASASPGEAEKRSMPKPQNQPEPDAVENAAAGADPTGENAARPDAKAAERLRGPLGESRRGWGHLPKRDRDELTQGVDDDFIPRYEDQINQYYRALNDEEQEEP